MGQKQTTRGGGDTERRTLEVRDQTSEVRGKR